MTGDTGVPSEAGGLCIVWHAADRTYPGERVSGDAHVVRVFDGGALVAVVDGLGHGPKAHHASRLAASVLDRRPRRRPADLVRRCHLELGGSRGVALSVASFDSVAGTMTWVAVGNVNGLLLRAAGGRETVLQRGGVVGVQLPRLQESTREVVAGDTLVFATDGIASGFVEGLGGGSEPRALARGILRQHGKRTDDALVVVARYVGQR